MLVGGVEDAGLHVESGLDLGGDVDGVGGGAGGGEGGAGLAEAAEVEEGLGLLQLDLHDEVLVLHLLQLLDEAGGEAGGLRVALDVVVQPHQPALQRLPQEHPLLLLRPVHAVLAHLHLQLPPPYLHTCPHSLPRGRRPAAYLDAVLLLGDAVDVEEGVEEVADDLRGLGLPHADHLGPNDFDEALERVHFPLFRQLGPDLQRHCSSSHPVAEGVEWREE